jgi:hypothetical protein
MGAVVERADATVVSIESHEVHLLAALEVVAEQDTVLVEDNVAAGRTGEVEWLLDAEQSFEVPRLYVLHHRLVHAPPRPGVVHHPHAVHALEAVVRQSGGVVVADVEPAQPEPPAGGPEGPRRALHGSLRVGRLADHPRAAARGVVAEDAAALPAQPVEARADVDPGGGRAEAASHALCVEHGGGPAPRRGREGLHEHAPEAGAGEEHDGEGDPSGLRVDVVAEAAGRVASGRDGGGRRECEPAVGGRVADEVAGPAAAQQQPAVRRLDGEVEHGDGALEEDRRVVPQFHHRGRGRKQLGSRRPVAVPDGVLGEAGHVEGDVDGGVGGDEHEVGVAELLRLEHNGVREAVEEGQRARGEVPGEERWRRDQRAPPRAHGGEAVRVPGRQPVQELRDDAVVQVRRRVVASAADRRNRTRRSHGGARVAVDGATGLSCSALLCLCSVLGVYLYAREVRGRRCASVDRERLFLFQRLRLYSVDLKVRVRRLR